MYSDYLHNQLMQEHYDFNQGEPDDEDSVEIDGTSPGLSPDEEF